MSLNHIHFFYSDNDISWFLSSETSNSTCITFIFISYLLLRAASKASDMAHRQPFGWVHFKDVHGLIVAPKRPYMLWYDNGDCIPMKMTTKQNKIKVLKVLIVLYRSPISIRSMLMKCFYNDKCRQMKWFFLKIYILVFYREKNLIRSKIHWV